MTPGRRETLLYPLTVLRFSLGYASYFLSKLIFVALAAPLILVLLPFPGLKHRVLRALTHGYLRYFSLRHLPWLGLYQVVEISGRDQAAALTPAIFTANHRGYMDGLFMLGLLPDAGVVIKSRYGRRPSYALLVRHFDLISIDPDRLSSVAAALEDCRQLVSAGKNLVMFPEGSRARSGRLQPFSALPFQLAKATDRPIVPVIIHSTRPFMAKLSGSIFPRGRNEYRIRFLDPEFPRPEDTADSLRDRVHRRMAQELRVLDAGTRWDTSAGKAHD